MSPILVTFSNPTGPPLSIGPFTQLFMKKRALREAPDGPVLATSVNLRWEPAGGGRFTRFDCDVRCSVTLEKAGGKSQRYGPYRSFASLNGLKYADHQMFALYDEQNQDFYGYESGTHWDTLIVAPLD